MDSRDSTQSTNANNSTDDDGVLSVTATLAKEAALYFQSRKFDDCIDLLNQLLEKKPDDPKILHNIAIAEYFRDGCTDTKKLLDALNNVKKRSEELAHASGEQVENSSNLGNKVILGSKGSGTSGHQFSAANSGSLVYMDEFDASVAKLNIAVIWFHLHEYAKALSILEPLYQNIEPIDETTALQICLLLLDVALACHDASRSADVLIYLEKAFGVGCVSQGDTGSMAQQQSANLLAKYSSVPASSSAADGSNSDLAASVNAAENPLTRTLSEETLEDDTVLALSTLEISGQNLTRPIGLSSANELSRTLVDKSISTVDLKLKLQLYKVRFLLLTRNLKQAKREVKHAMNIARGRDSSMALFLKSQLEYARGNHRKAIKLLLASSNRTEMGISSMFNNNLGCIYYQFIKHHTSSVFFSKALSNSAILRKDKPIKLLTFSQDKSLLITYNCGVQYLACGKPILAARCFQKASLVFYKRPLLWLRLAECCLMALEKGLIVAGRPPSDRSEVRVHVIGKGKWRHLLIEDGISKNGHVDSVEKEDLFFGSDGQPKLSISLARQCLTNALHLLNFSDSSYSKFGLPSNASVEENESGEAASSKNSNHKNLLGIDSKMPVGLSQVTANGDVKEQKGGTTLEIIQNSVSCYEHICTRENQMIKQTLLANLAYVELELENPVKALAAARSLLELPDCSRIYVFLGHVYAAEALCLLNKPKEAAEHFSKYLSGGNHVDLPFSQDDCEQWRVQKSVDCEELNGGLVSAKNSSPDESQDVIFPKPEEARGTLYADIAAMYAMQGELDRAHQFVMQALSLLPRSTEATLTAIYVDLMLGKSQEAIARLKHCSHVRFLPSGLQLSKSC
ncbi:CCR4-NOT transcription complex subunit 10-like isoform X1 [Pistacia vera]|uniref:CCR4-NOT transcription complex subunit 10-like isoform X1 n=1 Tax=Pistacia vera TaxID=55513 RepID=UPI001262B23E|nr:CCR4-NOT transcription complex subunit 10-like isoform X1 [Pistacia vera]XP_031282815.1 CCR4-NOT transcription complex subunit 10-like isoform X1 [Pistacia vera]